MFVNGMVIILRITSMLASVNACGVVSKCSCGSHNQLCICCECIIESACRDEVALQHPILRLPKFLRSKSAQLFF